ncbi:hypothetical protein QQ045_027803 [Rhodiola kirilowii]
MEPPQSQSIAKDLPEPEEDEQKNKIIDECCSCCYDCWASCFRFVFCSDD